MPTKPRPLTNNVGACIGDILALVMEIWPELVAASKRAEERHQDPILLAELNIILRKLSVIEYHARNAQANRYIQRPS